MTPTTRADIANLLALLKASFPNYTPEPDTPAVFYRLLSDVPKDLLEAAVIACVTERGRAFAPSIGEIRGAAGRLQIQAARIPTAHEAFNELVGMPYERLDPQLYEGENEAGERYLEVRQFEFSHPMVEKVARQLGWPRTFPGDHAGVDRAQFIRAYGAELERLLDLFAEHPAIPEYVAQHALQDDRPPVVIHRATLESLYPKYFTIPPGFKRPSLGKPRRDPPR